MSVDQTRQPTRRVSWYVLFGVILLIGSVLGARESFQSTSHTAAPSATTSDLPYIGGFGYVDIEGGVTNMYPLQPGRVVEVMAHDGEEVDKGAPLFKIDETAARIKLTEANVAVDLAKLKVSEAEDGAKRKITVHKALQAAQAKVIEAKKSQVKIAENQHAEAKRRFESGSIGIEKVHQAEEAVKAAKADLAAEEAKAGALVLEDTQILIDQAKANLKLQEQHVALAQYGVDECTVKAPAKGTVLRMLVAVGDPLTSMPRQAAVQFAIAGKLIIRAEIDQEFAQGLSAGQAAEVQDDTHSTAASWSGKVTRISDWYAHRRSIWQEPGQFNDVRTLEVIINLENAPKLRIGQRVRVTMK